MAPRPRHIVQAIVDSDHVVAVRVSCCLSVQLHQRAGTASSSAAAAAAALYSALNAAITSSPVTLLLMTTAMTYAM